METSFSGNFDFSKVDKLLKIQTVLSLDLQEDLEKKSMSKIIEDMKKKIESLLIENKTLKAHHDTSFYEQSDKKDYSNFRRFHNKSRDCIKLELLSNKNSNANASDRKNETAPLKPINEDFLKMIFLQAHSIEQLL